MPQLNAWVDGRLVGTFSEEHVADGSAFTFEYVQEATFADLVSLTMIPLPHQRRFDSRLFPPAFEMILPEGERRQRIEAARKILRTDEFSLLSYVGANPVNRVRFLSPDAQPNQAVPPLPTPKEIADCSYGLALFERLTRELDLRQGIAGVQPKVLGSSTPKLSLDVRQQRGSTHILKASTSAFPFLALNEYLCLQVLAEAGLETPKVTLSADGQLLLVERFDTLADGKHLGFEEVAVLMGETSATKYQRDYGSMTESLASFISPELEGAMRRNISEALVLNWLLGNGDAHLKNFGVLYRNDLDVQLAPFYDVVSTLAYIPDDVPALALSFDWYSKAWWPREKVADFCLNYGKLSPAEIRDLFAQCCSAMQAGIRLARRLGTEVPGCLEFASGLIQIWEGRIASFNG